MLRILRMFSLYSLCLLLDLNWERSEVLRPRFLLVLRFALAVRLMSLVYLAFRFENQSDTVYAVAFSCWWRPIIKNMAKMSATIGTMFLCARIEEYKIF